MDMTRRLIQERGFTLVEMVLALVILGIISGVAYSNISGSIEKIRLNGASQKLTSDIRYAREMALSRHDTYGLEFDIAGNFYQVFVLNGVTKTVINDPQKNTSMIIDFDDRPEFKGVMISSVNSCVGVGCLTAEIRFTSFGIPQDANNGTFTSAATVGLQNGSQTKSIQVNQQTAFTEIV